VSERAIKTRASLTPVRDRPDLRRHRMLASPDPGFIEHWIWEPSYWRMASKRTEKELDDLASEWVISEQDTMSSPNQGMDAGSDDVGA
jgi:hypothetical protein